MGNPWLGRSVATDAPVRLLCFPHAGGGGNFFRPWQRALAPTVDVRPVLLPGREARLRERPYVRVPELVETLLAAVAPCLDRPYALFGHSMGSVIAFELARAAEAHGQSGPVRLFVSARRAPHLPLRRAQYADLDDDRFLRAVASLGGTPVEVLRQPDLLRLFMPCLRADFELTDSYQPLPGLRLSCPVSAFIGDADPEVDVAELAAWAQVTTGEFTARVFPGGHFCLSENAAELFEAIRAGLGPAVAAQSAYPARKESS